MEKFKVKDTQGREITATVIGRGVEKYIVFDTLVSAETKRAPATYDVKTFKLFAPVELVSDKSYEDIVSSRMVAPVTVDELKNFKDTNPSVVFNGETHYRMGKEHATDDAVTRKNVGLKMSSIESIVSEVEEQINYISDAREIEKRFTTDVQRGRINGLDRKASEIYDKIQGIISQIEKRLMMIELAKEEGTTPEEYESLTKEDVFVDVPKLCEYCAKVQILFDQAILMVKKINLQEQKRTGKMDDIDRAEYERLLGNAGQLKQYEDVKEKYIYYQLLVDEEMQRKGIEREETEHYDEFVEAAEQHAQAKESLHEARDTRYRQKLNHYTRKHDKNEGKGDR